MRGEISVFPSGEGTYQVEWFSGTTYLSVEVERDILLADLFTECERFVKGVEGLGGDLSASTLKFEDGVSDIMRSLIATHLQK